ncbi:MAG: RagB/SusD family nutrient uptake outer membrane protein, partial [Bacteroidota bacterium]|nr:RagB/SusD family nutrient uptake outer membrane protein [Bacteroidota bacterium]
NLEKGRNYVNQVRERAKNSPRADSSPNYVIDTYNSAWTDAATARKAVRHERRIELGMEGKRLFDLRRWGNMVQTLNAFIANEGRTIPSFQARAFPVQAKHNALPIPLNAIDQSQGALTQNPGY